MWDFNDGGACFERCAPSRIKTGLLRFQRFECGGGPANWPSRRPPGRLPLWLPPFGDPLLNLVLSHSSVTTVRVALNNWPKMCEVGVQPEDRKGKCAPPRNLKVERCTDIRRPAPNDLPDREDNLNSVSKNEPTTIVKDFRFKAFGKPFYCAWDEDALDGDKYRRSDYVLNDFTIDETEVELWLASTQYSPAEYQLISDLLVTNGQGLEATKIGRASKIIETKLAFEHHAWSVFLTCYYLDGPLDTLLSHGRYSFVQWAHWYSLVQTQIQYA